QIIDYLSSISYTKESPEIIEDHNEKNIISLDRTLREISQDPGAWLNNPEVKEAFQAISSPDIENNTRILQEIYQLPIFPSILKEFYALNHIPIILTDNTNISQNPKKPSNLICLASAFNGVAFNRKLLNEFFNSRERKKAGFGKFDNEATWKRGENYKHVNVDIFTGLILPTSSIPSIIQTINIENEQQFANFLNEYQIFHKEYSPTDNRKEMSLALNILSAVHLLRNTDYKNKDKILNRMPECVKMYEAFMAALHEYVEMRRENPLYNPFFIPSELTYEKQYNEKEKELIAKTQFFIEEALNKIPPHKQFICSITLNDTGSNSINMEFHGPDGKGKIIHNLSVGTSDLNESIKLKKMLQSYVLNNQMVPLYLRDTKNGNSTKRNDLILPTDNPQAMMGLTKVGRYYAADVVLGENKFTIPLGIRVEQNDAQNTEYANIEVQKRFNILETHLEYLNSNKKFESLGEITEHIKSNLKEDNNIKFGWRISDTRRLENYGADYKLPFPASSDDEPQQIMKIKSAILEFNEFGEVNPYWRLNFSIIMSGLGENGEVTKKYAHSLNLHTSDELVAQCLAFDAMQSLEQNCKTLSDENPELRFKMQRESDEHGDIKLCLPSGITLSDPDPQNLAHLIDDIPNPKLNFQIAHEITDLENGNKAIKFTVQRGSEANGDLINFKNLSGDDMTLLVELKEENIDKFLEYVEQNFKILIQEQYGNRQGNGNRKARKEFRTETIEKYFRKVIDGAKNETEKSFVDKLKEVERPKLRDRSKPSVTSQGLTPSFKERVSNLTEAPCSLYLMLESNRLGEISPEYIAEKWGLSLEEVGNKRVFKIGYSFDPDQRNHSLNETYQNAAVKLYVQDIGDNFRDADKAKEAEDELKRILNETSGIRSLGGELFLAEPEIIYQIFTLANAKFAEANNKLLIKSKNQSSMAI
ncbi:MAG: hypothetical protein WCJ33_03145, partial [Pseudomonadota bacterium]